jgi:hypothetical protein
LTYHTEVISAVADSITAIAALAAMGVAVAGLRTWRHQLRGQSEYDLARRLLRAAYDVREQMQSVRGPFVSVQEMERAFEAANIEPDSRGVIDDPRTDELVYNRRFVPVYEAVSKLNVELLEAEVLWGTSVRESARPLNESVKELRTSIRKYLLMKRDAERLVRLNEEERETLMDVVYQSSADPADDPFSARVQKGISVLEDFLRPHLMRG